MFVSLRASSLNLMRGHEVHLAVNRISFSFLLAENKTPHFA